MPPFSPWGFQVYNVKLWKEDYFQSIATDIVELLFNRFDEDHNGVLWLRNNVLWHHSRVLVPETAL